jgi:hypothetical protein
VPQAEAFKARLRRFSGPGGVAVADALHTAWEAPPTLGDTRHDAILRWLNAHYEGQSFVVLDDVTSGTGLRGSSLDKAGCVVLCEQDVGLHEGHLPLVRLALK